MERTLKARLMKAFEAHGIPAVRLGAGPYGPSGLCDILACIPRGPNRGRFVWIEAKDPAKQRMKVRAVQRRHADRFGAAGAPVIISNDYIKIMEFFVELGALVP